MKNIFIIILFFPVAVFGQLKVPELWGVRVHDEAKVLSPTFVSQLEQKLKAHEDSTSNQIAVLVVPSLEGEVIEEYTLKVAEHWKLGQANNDNGVLLFIAVNDRKVRIEVGEGLEGPLPDAVCNQIIRHEIAPNFRQDNYEGGINAATTAIIQAIAGEYKADPQPVRNRKSRGGSIITTLIILAIIFIMSGRNRGGRGGRGGGWMAGPMWYGGGFSGRSGGGGWSGGGGFSGGGGGFSGGGSSGSW